MDVSAALYRPGIEESGFDLAAKWLLLNTT